VAVARSSRGGVVMLHTSGFVDDVMISYGGVTLPQLQSRCNAVHGLTPVLRGTCFVVSCTTAGAKTRRVPRARGAGAEWARRHRCLVSSCGSDGGFRRWRTSLALCLHKGGINVGW